MVKLNSVLLSFLLLSLNVKGVEKLKNVTPYHVGNNLFVELTASFNMGTPWHCPELVGIDTFSVDDSLFLRAYYDVSGIWEANFCNSIDTVNIGVLPGNLKMIKIEMYTTMYIPVDNDTDTTYRPQPWIIWLPLSINEASAPESLTISPNPNTGHFVLQGDLQGASRLDIVDVTGRAVYTDDAGFQARAFKKEIDINNAPPGLYMLRLYTDKGVLVRKVVVQ